MNRLELCNEYLILSSCIFFLIYSDGMLLIQNPGYPEYDEALPDMYTKFHVGWFNIAVQGLMIFINVVVMLTVQVHQIYSKIRICRLKCKHKKMMKKH